MFSLSCCLIFLCWYVCFHVSANMLSVNRVCFSIILWSENHASINILIPSVIAFLHCHLNHSVYSISLGKRTDEGLECWCLNWEHAGSMPVSAASPQPTQLADMGTWLHRRLRGGGGVKQWRRGDGHRPHLKLVLRQVRSLTPHPQWPKNVRGWPFTLTISLSVCSFSQPSLSCCSPPLAIYLCVSLLGLSLSFMAFFIFVCPFLSPIFLLFLSLSVNGSCWFRNIWVNRKLCFSNILHFYNHRCTLVNKWLPSQFLCQALVWCYNHSC